MAAVNQGFAHGCHLTLKALQLQLPRLGKGQRPAAADGASRQHSCSRLTLPWWLWLPESGT